MFTSKSNSLMPVNQLVISNNAIVTVSIVILRILVEHENTQSPVQ